MTAYSPGTNPFKKALKQIKITPPQVITISFAVLVLTGALLLNLPAASKNGESVGFINALFTATSASCVTGLVVVNTALHWTVFGKIVILGLIQIGAFGFITLLVFTMVLLHRQISLKDRLLVQTSFNQNTPGGMVRLIKKVIITTFSIEAAGALLLTGAFYCSSPGMPLFKAFYNGVFHSVSAFCNAGFDIIGTESLTPYRGNTFINLIIMALIVAGGLGFTVWGDLFRVAVPKRKVSLRKRFIHLSLHTKIALTVTVVLIAVGTALFMLFEWNNPNTLGGLSGYDKSLASLFQSVTLRTAGYNTISQGGLTDISKVFSCILMIIGGSPAGTAGGMKTVTIGVIIISSLSVLKGKRRIEAFGRSLSLHVLQKALTVSCMILLVVFFSATLLYFTEQNGGYSHTFLDLLFETCSAVGTVGVTTGITPDLTFYGKLIMTVCMFLGRLSPVTVAVSLNIKLHAGKDTAAYLEEPVIIG